MSFDILSKLVGFAKQYTLTQYMIFSQIKKSTILLIDFCIEKTKRMMKIIVAGREFVNATHGIIANNAAETGAPKTMKGRRLPSFEWQRSESLPKVGWKITDRKSVV